MILLEGAARLLLVVHAIAGAALVGAATHLAWWSRRIEPHRERQARIRRMAWSSVALFALTVALGLAIYPSYKIRVRGEFLDSGDAVLREYRGRMAARAQFLARHYGAGGPSANADPTATAGADRARESGEEEASVVLPRRTVRVARWFEVKEHWAALGLIAAVVLAIVLTAWDPADAPRAVVPVVRTLAVSTAAVAWLAAIVGLIATSYRSVAGFG